MEIYQKKIIELFIEQELLIASLYMRFSERYVVHKNFWLKLASEEREHAEWIKHLLDGVETDKIFFSEGKTRTYTVNSSITYIKGLISEFDKKAFDIPKAAHIALDLEKSLLEKNVFNCFDSDSIEVKRILEVLNKGQDDHIRMMDKFSTEIREKVKSRQSA
jgi:rubrerythrin